MARYTIELYKLLDPDAIQMHQKVKAAWDSVTFTDDVDNAHREKLYEDFCARYAMHEIGFETPALFVQQLKAKMREVYNKYDMKFVTLTDILSLELKEPAVKVVETIWGKKTQFDIQKNVTDQHSGTDKTYGDVTRTGSQTDATEQRSIHDATPNRNISISTEFSQNNYADDLTHSKGTDTTTYNSVKDAQDIKIDHGEKVESTGKTKDGFEQLSGTDKVTTKTTDGLDMFDELEKFKNKVYNLDNEFVDEFKDLFMRIF